jgi:hypothetical protein
LCREIDARVQTDERVPVLFCIRGIGRYTAMLIIAEAGDVKRSPTARHPCAWAGSRRPSAAPTARRASGHISREGSTILRWALDRGGAADPHRRRSVARVLRAGRQAPRAQDRQGRDRPPDPHPLLLRAQPKARSAASNTSPTPTTTTSWPRPHDQRQLTPDSRAPPGREAQARASSLLCLASVSNSSTTAVRLNEPPSTARRPFSRSRKSPAQAELSFASRLETERFLPRFPPLKGESTSRGSTLGT